METRTQTRDGWSPWAAPGENVAWILGSRVGTVVFLVLLASLVFLALVHSRAGPGEERLVQVPAGLSGQQLTRLLADEGIIGNENLFSLLMRSTGAEHQFLAGSYLLGPEMTLWEVVTRFSGGQVVDDQLTVTIPEGFDVRGMARLLEEKGLLTSDEFLMAAEQAAGSRDFLPRFNPEDGWAVEGYLYPDTYRFSPQEPAPSIVDRMLARFEEKALPLLEEETREGERDLHQVLTLASLVEREVVREEELELAASVFYNRLDRGMRLESCATVQYLLGEPQANLSRADLSIPSPYNTYLHPGLPPGPIASPGLPAIRAVREPAETNYLFFVAAGDGSHIFTRSYAEHLEARNQAREEPAEAENTASSRR